MKLKLKDTVLDSNIILAPMAGVTDLPFRLLCREQGCGDGGDRDGQRQSHFI